MVGKKLDSKFYGNKPLKPTVKNGYPKSLNLEYRDVDPPKELRLIETMICKKIEGSKKIVFGIIGKEEKLVEYDFLNCWEGGALIVHRRVLEKLQQMCPDDFQTLPVIVKNFNPKDQAFENKDFYIINVLAEVDVIDKEKTYITYTEKGNLEDIKNIHFRENCMEGHLLARDRLDSITLVFDPKLAIEFVKSKGIDFTNYPPY